MDRTAQNGRSQAGDSILLSSVDTQPVKWLWRNRLAFRKLAIIDGDPGFGKSLIALDIAARLSSGRAMPGETEVNDLRDVLLIMPEDDAGDTLRPRLQEAGANLDRIWIFSDLATFELPDSAGRLSAALSGSEIGLVVIDPIMGCLAKGVKPHEDASVRAALGPLKAAIEKGNAAGLLIRHLNKSGGDRALYRGGGSIAFVGLCRTALIVAEHPEDIDRRVLASVKNNVGKLAAPLSYRIQEGAGGVVVIRWDASPPIYDADSLLSASHDEDRRKIIVALGKYDPRQLTPHEVARELGYPPDQDYSPVRRRLSNMLRAGQIASNGPGFYGLRHTDTGDTARTRDTARAADTEGASVEEEGPESPPASVSPVSVFHVCTPSAFSDSGNGAASTQPMGEAVSSADTEPSGYTGHDLTADAAISRELAEAMDRLHEAQRQANAARTHRDSEAAQWGPDSLQARTAMAEWARLEAVADELLADTRRIAQGVS